MSYSLTNENGDTMEINHFGWPKLLQAAQDFGWTPRGTIPPVDGMTDSESFDSMDYFTEDGRRICAEDAYALADALEIAKQELSKAEYINQVALAQSQAEAFMRELGLVPVKAIEAMSPQRWLISQKPETVTKCITLFRGGAVTIR